MPSTYKGSPITISSREESYTEDGKIAVTVTFTGDVDVLRSQKPATGDELAGYEDDGVVVRSVKISRPGTGRLGTMVVEANNELSDSGSGGQTHTSWNGSGWTRTFGITLFTRPEGTRRSTILIAPTWIT